MNARTITRSQENKRPNYLLGIYVVFLTILTLSYSVITAIATL